MFQQNQLFRTHATGNFGTLVLHVIRDPAMIKYLDNDDSRKGRPNENLARELLELFVLGIAQDGGVPHFGCNRECCERARREGRWRADGD